MWTVNNALVFFVGQIRLKPILIVCCRDPLEPDIKKVRQVSVRDAIVVRGVGEPDVGALDWERRTGRVRSLDAPTSRPVKKQKLFDHPRHCLQCGTIVTSVIAKYIWLCKIPKHRDGLTSKHVTHLGFRVLPLAKRVADVSETAQRQPGKPPNGPRRIRGQGQ